MKLETGVMLLGGAMLLTGAALVDWHYSQPLLLSGATFFTLGCLSMLKASKRTDGKL